MQATILSFPGSNREYDVQYALLHAGFRCRIVSAQQRDDFDDSDLIVLPGGFSYGDYLRCGALAAKLPIIDDLRRAADQGRHILGICNGFQILTESSLLPGALRINARQHFICRNIILQVVSNRSAFSSCYEAEQHLHIPIAHHEGNYTADPETIQRLEEEGRILFRYLDNPNGSMADIAGITNRKGNVLGLMPHPENAVLAHHHSHDGLGLFLSLMKSVGS